MHPNHARDLLTRHRPSRAVAQAALPPAPTLGQALLLFLKRLF
ncbi:hypothetical protein AB9K41_30730 [Cribrihabitans sp. XS_ASV171]